MSRSYLARVPQGVGRAKSSVVEPGEVARSRRTLRATGSAATTTALAGQIRDDGRAVGRIRYGNPELTEALNLADGLARSPASIASFLEAAGAAALELAGKILVRRS